MTKTETFAKELEYIQNDDIKSFLAIAIENLPDYFFKVAASSTNLHASGMDIKYLMISG